VIRLIDGLIVLFSRFPHSLIALLARLAIGLTFWNSGQTKLEGYVACLPKLSCFKANPFSLNDSAIALFENEYLIPHIPPWLAAHAAALAEFVLPVLLFIGLATRFAAFGLLVMTLVIEIFVYPGAYVIHGLWAAILITLIKYGPGKIALDHWLARRY
jgi:putative oxidoreductase